MIRVRRLSAVAVAAVIAAGAGLLTFQSGALTQANQWVFDGVGGSSVAAAGAQASSDVTVRKVATLATPSAEQTAAVLITPTAKPVRLSASSSAGRRVPAATPASASSTRATPKSAVTTRPKPKPTPKPTPKPPRASTSTTAPAPVSGAAAEVVRLTNIERQAKGCPALKVNAALTTSASRHSADMAQNDYFDHNSLDGRSPFDRMKAAGYSYSRAAENIAAGQPTAAAVVAGWMNSAGHRANILNCDLAEIGVGVAKGGHYGIYWTQNFGTPR